MARDQINYWLVMDLQLAVLKRPAQITSQMQAPKRLLLHRPGEIVEPVPPGGFRCIHRVVGIAYQLFRFAGVIGIQGDADARRHMDDFPVQMKWPYQGGDDFLCNSFHMRLVIQLRQDDSELISTRPGNGIGFAHTRTQALARLLQ